MSAFGAVNVAVTPDHPDPQFKEARAQVGTRVGRIFVPDSYVAAGGPVPDTFQITGMRRGFDAVGGGPTRVGWWVLATGEELPPVTDGDAPLPVYMLTLRPRVCVYDLVRMEGI